MTLAVFEATGDDAQSVSRALQFVDDAVLVASELVTNAILHAGGQG